jgi:peptide methionine sulfoxide reductase MsrB
MDANQKATVKDVSQQKVEKPQSELNVIEKQEVTIMRVKSPQKLENEEEKYVSTLGWPAGWLTALSGAIAAIAVSSVP